MSKNITTIEEWREVIREHFPTLEFPAEIGMSVIAQLLIKDITNPFGLVYVDVPSAGKTIALNFFSDSDKVYATDNFSPAAFVTHAANVKPEKLKEIDLLPKIKDKAILIRDLAPIFGKREEDLSTTMGILTRVFDGEGLETDSGLHGKRGYKGEYNFVMLAGSTPIRPAVWKMMGNFGSRLFFYNINSEEKPETELVGQLRGGSVKEKELACRKATKEFIEYLFTKHASEEEWDPSQDSEQLTAELVKIGKLLARLRGIINVWEEKWDDGTYNHSVPSVEMPDRINQLLYNLARGHALACGRKQINKEDIELIKRVAIDSAPPLRARVFNKLLQYGGKMKASDIQFELGYSNPTALKKMEEMKHLDLVEVFPLDEYSTAGQPAKIMELKEEFKWLLPEKEKQEEESESKEDTVDVKDIGKMF